MITIRPGGESARKAPAQAHREDLLWRRIEELESGNRALREKQETLAETNERCLRMARTIGHELRNTLNPITVAVRMLRSHQQDAESEDLRQIIGRAMESANQLVEQLSDYSALLSGRLALRAERFSARMFYDEICTEFAMLAKERGLHFSGSFDLALGELVADRQKLKEIAENLLSNAVKYTSEGEVEIAFATLGEQKWEMVVRDTGIGIPHGMEERIFDEFERGQRANQYGGSGLGLAIVRRLASLCGGTVRAERVEKGSLFRVILPLMNSSGATPDLWDTHAAALACEPGV